MSEDFKYLIKKIVLIFITLGVAHYTAFYFGIIYDFFFPKNVGGNGLFSIPHEAGLYLIGLPLSYIFFLSLLFTAFGGSKKYWWMGVLLIPAAVFELYFDLAHIYFPILLGLAGWLLGLLALKFSTQKRTGFARPL